LRRLCRESNARIHAVATVLVIGIGSALRLTVLEWVLLALAATLVWVAEAMNTALEVLSDAAVPEHSPLVGAAKDVAAGAVLLAAIGAVVVGLLVFVPHLPIFTTPH
jgi:diacylglycerol kinase